MPVFIDPKFAQYFTIPNAILSLSPKTELPEDYYECADFSRPRYNISKCRFQLLRLLINLPLFILAIVTWLGTPKKLDLFFYESEWGVYLTTFSSIMIYLASVDRDPF